MQQSGRQENQDSHTIDRTFHEFVNKFAMTNKSLNTKKLILPAEWARQDSLWTIWPSHPELWQGALLEDARAEIAQMVRAIATGQNVKVLVYGDEAMVSARKAVGDVAEVLSAKFGDLWLRDTGAIFAYDNAQLIGLRFQTNGWGGKYIYEFDDIVGDTIANLAGAKIRRYDFVLEGGSIEHDGEGTILTTRQCVLNDNRNPHWSESDAESALKNAFNVWRIIWLEDGMLNDHTDGHIDNIARFVAPNHVVCQSAFGDDDPNTRVFENIYQTLKKTGLQVTQIPSPGLYCSAEGEIVPASHMNFIIGNDVVVVPVYGTASQDQALSALQKLFPGRKVIGVSSKAVLTGGGSFHCITQQQPALMNH